jgi:hypothetical protein
MIKRLLMSFALVFFTSWAWAQLTIPPADKQKAVNCSGSATISVNNSGGVTYIASVSGGLVIEDGGQEKSLIVTSATSLTVSAASGAGKLYIVDASTGVARDSAEVTVNPVVLSAISGPECIDQTGTATYSVTPIAGVTYIWVVERGGIRIVSGQGTNSVTVQSVSKANSHLVIYVYNSCIAQLCSAPRRGFTIRKLFPEPVDGLVGPNCLDPTTLAANDSIIAFFIEPVLGDFAGANSNDYLWNVPSILQPKFSSPDGSARAFKVLNASNDFSVSVTVGAKCNPDNVVSKDINVPPPVPIMSQTDYCFPSSQTLATFSVSPSYHRPDFSYQWILPLNWHFADANTTSSSVNVVMDPNAGNVIVIADNAGCGHAQTTFTVNRVISGAAITTTNGACLAYGDTSEKTYSISPPNNNQYNWTLPAGWTFKPGTPTNTSSIIVIPSGTNGGSVAAATQGCGGVSSTIPPITVALGPVAPVYATGPLCISGSTTSTVLTYTVNNLGSGITYYWKFPSGWVLNSNGSPVSSFVTTATNSIAVRFSSARTTGMVSVYAKGCIESAITTWEVYDTPAVPVLLTGNNCPNQGTGTTTYQVGVVYNSNYLWTVGATNGWTAVNPSESSRTAVFNVGNGPSTITVRAVGVLGCAGVQSAPLNVPVNLKPANPIIVRTDAGCIAAGASDEITLSVQNQGTMPVGVSYAWTMPTATPPWTASTPNAATTNINTNGVPKTNPGYTVSVAVSNTLCGASSGSLEIPISAGLSVNIFETELDPEDIENDYGGFYYYGVPATTGATYSWKMYNRNTRAFLYTPIRRSTSRPYEVFLDQPLGFTSRILATDSLVVTITESSGCQTTKYTVRENYAPSGFSLAFSGESQQSSSARTAASSSKAKFDVNEIDAESGSNEFAVYPNPAKERVTVEWPKGKAKLFKVIIMDIRGGHQKVVEVTGRRKAEIDISDLIPATYVVVIKSDQGVAYEKLVIN